MASLKLCTMFEPPPLPEEPSEPEKLESEDTLSLTEVRSDPPEPSRLAVYDDLLWANGQTLLIDLDGGSYKVRKKVRYYARLWTEHANLNLKFVEKGTSRRADIRVTFVPDGTSWSYIGKSCVRAKENKATMNFGWLDDKTSEEEFASVVLHEFGHALGCIHEHKSPEGGIQWNDEKVYEYYRDKHSWDREKVRREVLRRYTRDHVRATDFDPHSIMLYHIPAHLTRNGFSTPKNFCLSEGDKTFIAKTYPKEQKAKSARGIFASSTRRGALVAANDANGSAQDHQESFVRRFIEKIPCFGHSL